LLLRCSSRLIPALRRSQVAEATTPFRWQIYLGLDADHRLPVVPILEPRLQHGTDALVVLEHVWHSRSKLRDHLFEGYAVELKVAPDEWAGSRRNSTVKIPNGPGWWHPFVLSVLCHHTREVN
jgi:hypothetical protein